MSEEVYIAEHSEATFSHGLCPDCRARPLQPHIDALRRRREGG